MLYKFQWNRITNNEYSWPVVFHCTGLMSWLTRHSLWTLSIMWSLSCWTALHSSLPLSLTSMSLSPACRTFYLKWPPPNYLIYATSCPSTLRSKKEGKQKRKNEEEVEEGESRRKGRVWRWLGEVRGEWSGHGESQGMTAVCREERDRVSKWSESSVVFFFFFFYS